MSVYSVAHTGLGHMKQMNYSSGDTKRHPCKGIVIFTQLYTEVYRGAVWAKK